MCAAFGNRRLFLRCGQFARRRIGRKRGTGVDDLHQGGAASKDRPFDPVSAHEESERHCSGPGGFDVRYVDVVMRAGLTFTFQDREPCICVVHR